MSARAWVVTTLVAAAGIAAFVGVSLVGRDEKPSAAVSAPMAALAAAEATGSAPRVELSPAPAPSSAAADRVELTVRVEPSLARILVDGQPVENPFHGSYVRANSTHHIVARAWGFESKSEDVLLTSDMIVSLALERSIVPAAPAPPPAAHPAPRRAPPPAPSAVSEPAPPSPAVQSVDPSGGHAPVRIIDTKDPYRAP
jgi:hypothetical protein